MLDTAVRTRKLARRFVVIVALAQLLVLASWAFSMQSRNSAKPKVQKEDARHQIDSLEEKWRNAILKNDVAALDTLLADDYVGIMTNGTLETKDQTLENLRMGKWHFTALDISERKVRFYGRTALVTCLVQVEGTGPEGTVNGTYRYTRVYARDARGTWRIVNFEANRLGRPRHPGDTGKAS